MNMTSANPNSRTMAPIQGTADESERPAEGALVASNAGHDEPDNEQYDGDPPSPEEELDQERQRPRRQHDSPDPDAAEAGQRPADRVQVGPHARHDEPHDER